MFTKEYLIVDNFHGVGFLWIMQGWRLCAWEVLKEIVPHSLELKERIPYPVRLDEVPCKERLLKEKKGRKSIASVAQLQLELQRWRLQQWCHTQYWITLLPLAMASSSVWLCGCGMWQVGQLQIQLMPKPSRWWRERLVQLPLQRLAGARQQGGREASRQLAQDILSLWSFLLLPPQLVLSYYAAKNRNDVDSDSDSDVAKST